MIWNYTYDLHQACLLHQDLGSPMERTDTQSQAHNTCYVSKYSCIYPYWSLLLEAPDLPLPICSYSLLSIASFIVVNGPRCVWGRAEPGRFFGAQIMLSNAHGE